jgi:hypothetical protein
MQHLKAIGILAVIFLMAIVFRPSSETAPASNVTVEVQPKGGIDFADLPPEIIERNARHHAQATQARMQTLSVKDKEIQARRNATERTRQSRVAVATRASGPYRQVIQTNMSAWARLLAQAKASESGRVYCTICAGDHYLPFCVVCKDGYSECPTCKGSGKQADLVCPTCLGTTWCYLCSGTWEMLCPFCDDGEVDRDLSKNPPKMSVPLLIGEN